MRLDPQQVPLKICSEVETLPTRTMNYNVRMYYSPKN
jgi:hypothetical protein